MDGRTELILTPLELLDRLAHLVTPPRIHKHRYCGVPAARTAGTEPTGQHTSTGTRVLTRSERNDHRGAISPNQVQSRASGGGIMRLFFLSAAANWGVRPGEQSFARDFT
jgi:hypothetical protein